MRLAEAKIKEAIVHPEKLVRQEALLYFADCYSRDAGVMPLAIRAIETYGRSQELWAGASGRLLAGRTLQNGVPNNTGNAISRTNSG